MCLSIVTTALTLKSWSNVYNYASKADGVPDLAVRCPCLQSELGEDHRVWVFAWQLTACWVLQGAAEPGAGRTGTVSRLGQSSPAVLHARTATRSAMPVLTDGSHLLASRLPALQLRQVSGELHTLQTLAGLGATHALRTAGCSWPWLCGAPGGGWHAAEHHRALHQQRTSETPNQGHWFHRILLASACQVQATRRPANGPRLACSSAARKLLSLGGARHGVRLAGKR